MGINRNLNWSKVAAHLRHERAVRGLGQRDVAEMIVQKFRPDAQVESVLRSISTAENRHKTYGRRPPIIDQLAALYSWPPGGVDRLLDGGELNPDGRPPTISAETKAQVLRTIEESDRGQAWKRDAREYWGSIPVEGGPDGSF